MKQVGGWVGRMFLDPTYIYSRRFKDSSMAMSHVSRFPYASLFLDRRSN